MPPMPDKEEKGYSNREIDLLIDKKLADAKLDLTEKRLSHTLWAFGILLAVAGIGLPIYMAYTTSDKTDKAIDKMQQQVREVIGTALLKPKLDCFVDGKRLDGGELRFSPGKRRRTIEVRNVGDATAKNIQVRIYCALKDQLSFQAHEGSDGSTAPGTSDELEFGSNYYFGRISVSLNPKDSTTLSLDYYQESFPTTNAPSLIKVYCEQQDPRTVTFSMVFSDKD